MKARHAWITPDARRIFLVPSDVPLPPGPDEVRRPFSKDVVHVDLRALIPWEVDGKGSWSRRSGGAKAEAKKGAEAVRDFGRALAEKLRKPEVQAAMATLSQALAEVAAPSRRAQKSQGTESAGEK